MNGMKLNISSQDVDKLKTLLHILSIKLNFLTQSHRSCESRNAAVALKSKNPSSTPLKETINNAGCAKNILSFSLTLCIAILLEKKVFTLQLHYFSTIFFFFFPFQIQPWWNVSFKSTSISFFFFNYFFKQTNKSIPPSVSLQKSITNQSSKNDRD